MGSTYQPWDWLLPINSHELPFGDDGISFPFSNDYTWIFVCAIIIAFYAAGGIGANDVANSFATSVGSKSLTIFQAVIIAGIFEFLGAVLLGASVTDTIRGGLLSTSDFVDTPDLLMMGMFAALISVAFWLTLATVKEMPVSTTHSIVGGVLGFALCLPEVSIKWEAIGKIVASWFLSPALSGVSAALFFFLIRTLILRSENSFDRVLGAFPIIVWFVATINIWFIIIKGGKSYKWSEKLGGDWASLGVAAAIALGFALLIRILLVPRIRTALTDVKEGDIENVFEEEDGDVRNEDELALEDQQKPSVSGVQQVEVKSASKPQSTNRFVAWTQGKDQKIREIRNDKVASIHANAEKFEYRTELAFGYVQVFTACMMAFAHGANDVANAIGPLASIVNLYHTNGEIIKKAPVPVWILALGGAGIVVGLAVYGYKVIRALGVKLIKVTPSRGSCIELATAFVIVIGSILGLPLSTTHTMVGATIGVGLLEGNRKSINYKLLAKILAGWVITIIVAGAFSAAIFSFVVYGPSLNRPMAPQNCVGQYGVTYASGQTISLAANSTVLVGDDTTGAFSIMG